MKIYTKRGDNGQTDLFGGARVSKSHPQVMAYGAVDAANSAIGFVAACGTLDETLTDRLHGVMSDLFDIGAELSTAPKDTAQEKLARHLDSAVDVARVTQLERWIDEAEAELAPLKAFVLPTGSEAAARFHLARSSVRGAEQEVVAFKESGGGVRDELLQYLNRLSDLLFVWARWSNHKAGVSDVFWRAKK